MARKTKIKFKDAEAKKDLVEEIVPFGSGEFDYDDDALEIYGDDFDADIEAQIKEDKKNAGKVDASLYAKYDKYFKK